MCGILGQYFFSENSEINNSEFQLALDKLNHRGPDNNSCVSLPQIIIGHTRLSVIDRSSNSDQPFSNSRYTLTFNGEIYNHPSLKIELESLGVKFHTQSDTEVLFQSLIKWGKAALQKMNGQFAFAFYDNEKRSLILVRDRFGIKPLWYSQNDISLCFSSELKALNVLSNSHELDETSLSNYFQKTYISAPHSIFKQCKKLLPGEILVVENGEVSLEKWYDSNPSEQQAYPTDNPTITLKELMHEAVKERMIADVPLGSFLSGGLDSSIVATIASQYKTDLHTFSIGFKDNSYIDESKYAEMMAKNIGSQHHSFRLSEDDLLEHLDGMLNSLDEPFADSSALAVYILSKETKKHVTVALSGDGADELFGGYNKHKALSRLINPGTQEKIVNALSDVWRVAPKSRENYIKNKLRQFDRFSSLSQQSIEKQYSQLASFTDERYLEGLLLSLKTNRVEELDFSSSNDILNTILKEDQRVILPNDMLTKVDSMSMAHSLEVRTPFLDHRVVEFANSLPSRLKYNKTAGKIILREAFKNDLPEEILKRPKKGFEIPVEHWLRTALKSRVEELTDRERIMEQGVFSWEKVEELNNRFYKDNNTNLTSYMWAMFVFQNWLKGRS